MTDPEFNNRLQLWADRAREVENYEGANGGITFAEAMIFVAIMELEDTQRRALHKKMLEGKGA